MYDNEWNQGWIWTKTYICCLLHIHTFSRKSNLQLHSSRSQTSGLRCAVQWILPTVSYVCVTFNLRTQQTFKLRTLQRVRARIIPNITWRDHKTAQYIGAKNKTRYTRFHGNDNQTQMVLGCITFGTYPGIYTKLGRSRTYLKDCFWLAGKTIGIVT